MAKLTTAEFIEAIKELSVLELNELVKACEEEFGVSAAAGVVVAAAGAGAAAGPNLPRLRQPLRAGRGDAGRVDRPAVCRGGCPGVCGGGGHCGAGHCAPLPKQGHRPRRCGAG